MRLLFVCPDMGWGGAERHWATLIVGLADRGVIRPGAHADLVLFDPDTIIDVGTFDDPQHPPAGIVGVWVNGERVVVDGAHTGARPGRTLRRA